MPILASELVAYSAANVPEDDVSTSGGARSSTSRPELTQLTAASVIAVVSDGADTRTVTITGRLQNGVPDTEVLNLNGTNEVVGAKTFERILKVVASGTDAARTITVRQGSAGPTRATITPNTTTRHIFFQRSSSDLGAPVARYEKFFWRNEDDEALALQSAEIELTADPEAKIEIGVAASIDDSGSVTNRLTAPGGISFVDDNVAQSVPGGVLDNGEAIGVWVEQSLAASDTPYRSTFTTACRGITT